MARPISKGEPINRRARINAIVNEINELHASQARAAVGVGKTADGVTYPIKRGGRKEDRTSLGGAEKQLSCVMGSADTDRYSRWGDDLYKRLQLSVITDWHYDTSTHQITVRTRTLTFDVHGCLVDVSEESEPIIVHTAEPCPQE